jgi:hypothetical protein
MAGVVTSASDATPDIFSELLREDISLNDPICTRVLSTAPLTHDLIDDNLLSELISSKPDNIRVLTYHMITSIHKVSQVPPQADLPDVQLIPVLN